MCDPIKAAVAALFMLYMALWAIIMWNISRRK
jgi:hypothetical protein